MIPAVDPIDVDPIDVGKLMQAHAGNSLGFAVDSTLPASLTAQVAQGLREAIRKGVLKVGEPLPPREALAQRLGVSECVVRAALRDLAADRLVVGKPRRGHVVLAVPQERRARLVLDIETANLGSFCSHISVMASLTPSASVTTRLRWTCATSTSFAVTLRSGSTTPLSQNGPSFGCSSKSPP